jgi:hypothetical protein
MYGMMRENLDYTDSLFRAVNLFNDRVLKYRSDNLFVTDFSKNYSRILHDNALENIQSIQNMIL